MTNAMKMVDHQLVELTDAEQQDHNDRTLKLVEETRIYENDYARKRLAEYPSIEELTVALWEGVVEERMAAVTSLEGKRQAVKAKYPK